MGFIVKLGVCTDPVNKISKNFTNVTEYECTVKRTDGINIMNPIILIQEDNVINYNYCYIPNFSRYYYIKTISINPNGLFELELSEDVLMSDKDGILSSRAKLERSADYRNYYIQDRYLPVTNKKIISTRVFPNSPFDGNAHGAIATIIGPQN